MRRGCFLITPGVFQLIISAYDMCTTGRVRTLSKLHKCLYPTGRMGSASVICDHLLLEVRDTLSSLGESSVHTKQR